MPTSRQRLKPPLTPRQRDVLEALITLWRRKGHSPSQQEVADRLEITASSVSPHIKALKEKGYLQREQGRFRSVVPTHDPDGFSLKQSTPLPPPPRSQFEDVETIKILGEIAAGQPLEANENVLGEITLSRSLVGAPQGRKTFALRVQGKSMIGDGIFPGDLIIVVPQHTATEGEIIVALIDGDATVKRFHRKGEVIALLPSNPKIEPILVGPDDGRDLRVLGTVVSVHRTLGSCGRL